MPDIPQTLEFLHYRRLLEPYIHCETGEDLGFLYRAAWQAWATGIQKDDKHIENMLFTEWICEELSKLDEAGFIEMASLLGEDQHESAVRLDIVADLDHNVRQDGNVNQKFRALLGYYNTLFESEFRLWSTPAFRFGVQCGSFKSKAKTVSEFLQVSAGTKFDALKSVTIHLTQGNLADLAGDFDKDIRNAGVAHDSYEISDDGTLILKPTDPVTGRLKAVGQKYLAEDELRQKLKAAARTVWSIKMGFVIFLINNPKIRAKLQRTKPFKKDEILSIISAFTYDRWFLIDTFELDRQKKICTLKIRLHNKVYKSEGGMIYLGTVVRRAIVQKELKVKYKNTMVPLLHRLVNCFKPDELPHLAYAALNEKCEIIGEMEFDAEALKSLYRLPRPEELVEPTKGKWPDAVHDRIVEIPVKPEEEMLWKKILAAMPNEDVEFNREMDWGKKNPSQFLKKYSQ